MKGRWFHLHKGLIPTGPSIQVLVNGSTTVGCIKRVAEQNNDNKKIILVEVVPFLVLLWCAVFYTLQMLLIPLQRELSNKSSDS